MRRQTTVILSLVLAGLLALPIDGSASDSPAAIVADGQPWTSTTSDGRTMKITFFPDGRARIRVGIISRSLTWKATADGLCLEGGPQGNRCLRLEMSDTGVVGYDGTAAVMTLTR